MWYAHVLPFWMNGVSVGETKDISLMSCFIDHWYLTDYRDVDGVLKRANNTEYALASGVFTKDLAKALDVADRLEAGTVFVNTYNKTDVASPFGGFKQSGFGKDLGESTNLLSPHHPVFLCPALAEHTVFVVSVRNGNRRVRSQWKSVDWGTMGTALGGTYECYAHISSLPSFLIKIEKFRLSVRILRAVET